MIHYRHDRARQNLPSLRIIQQRKLASIVDDALASTGVSPTRFGRDAVNDPRLVEQLRSGRKPRPETRATILAHVERICAQAVRP